MRRLTSGYTVASLPPQFLFLVIKGHPCAPLTVSRRYFHATPWSTRLSYRHIEDTLRGPPLLLLIYWDWLLLSQCVIATSG